MPSWWGKSSSKEEKRKTSESKESFIDALQQKFRFSSDGKFDGTPQGSRRHCLVAISERGSQSHAESSSPFSSKHVARCQSFADRPLAQHLPLPAGGTDSGISVTTKPRVEKSSRSSLFPSLPKPACLRGRADPLELDSDLVTASISSESSIDSENLTDSRMRSPSDGDNGTITAAGSPSRIKIKAHVDKVVQTNPREVQAPINIESSNQNSPASSRQPLRNHVPSLLVPRHGSFFSAPDSSMSSPSRSPKSANEQVMNIKIWAGKPFSDVNLVGSGHCSNPGSGQNSGHNSMAIGREISGQLFWQPCRSSPEYSPIPSPRMASPRTGSRVQSGAVTPVHPRADDVKPHKQKHRLLIPPVTIPNSSPFSDGNSAATSPSVPRSPARTETPTSPASRWKKGKLLGRGTFGHVYVGFNSETGEMCAMKEVTLFSDDAKSRESAKQLSQEISLLSKLRHPNIVQYYGSETVDDKLYIYLEYVSGGSLYKILQEYGKLGEVAIRSYTQQILSGIAYLHGKQTVHRDIKGANILVDPSGRVKVADFGMAKHISGQSCPLSFKGSPYWMAPEVIKNSNGCNLAVDIWSLGCTVLEMATTKPPWSQYEGVAAMFKIGNSKEQPAIPDHLSEEGKEFVRLCLQRNPQNRPTAAQLLDHSFVSNAALVDRPLLLPEPADHPAGVTNGIKSLGIVLGRNIFSEDSERLAVHSSRVAQPRPSEYLFPRNTSCPVSPIGSPLAFSRSPHLLNGITSPSPISSPLTTSGASTPLTVGGTGAIPFNISQQTLHLQDGFRSIPKSPNSSFLNFPSYLDPNPILLHTIPRSYAFQELVHSGSETLERSIHRDQHIGQSVLADQVSQQLLKDQVKLNSSLGLSPNSTWPSRNNIK